MQPVLSLKLKTKPKMLELLALTSQIEEVFLARPLSMGALLAIFTAITVLSVYLYRRPGGMPLGVRVFLALSRIVVLSLVVATLLEPTAVVTESRTLRRVYPFFSTFPKACP